MAKILLVEDDSSLREIYSIRLTAEGYEVASAGDGEEALATAVREKPDLVLSDVMMPKISGFDMLDILRQTPETKDIKVIMMTALSSEDQRERGNALGANRYLVKSQVGIEDVVNAVHDVLGDNVAQTNEPQAPASQDTQNMQNMQTMPVAEPAAPATAPVMPSVPVMPTAPVTPMAEPVMPAAPVLPQNPAPAPATITQTTPAPEPVIAEMAAPQPVTPTMPVTPAAPVTPPTPVAPAAPVTPAAPTQAFTPEQQPINPAN